MQALPATPPVYGLLVAADIADPVFSGVDAIWQTGIEWAPEQIAGGHSGVINCEPPSSDPSIVTTAGNEGTLNANPVTQTADPVLLYATDQCSTFGWQARDYEGRARRQLNATQSFSLAQEFQLGALRDADGLGNWALKDAQLIDPSPAAVSNAIAELEGAIAWTLKGRRAMIHVTPQVFALMHGNYLLEHEGQKWVTAQGSIVVSDAGYAPESGGVYAYATPLVRVALGDVIITPGTLPEARAQATDRETNLTTILAQRLALIQVDGGMDQTATGHVSDVFCKVEVNVAKWIYD